MAKRFHLSTWLEQALLPAVQTATDSRRRAPRKLDEGIIEAMRRESAMHLLAVDNRRQARRAQLLPRAMQDSVFAYRTLYFLSRVGPKASRRGFRVIYHGFKVNRYSRG